MVCRQLRLRLRLRLRFKKKKKSNEVEVKNVNERGRWIKDDGRLTKDDGSWMLITIVNRQSSIVYRLHLVLIVVKSKD